MYPTGTRKARRKTQTITRTRKITENTIPCPKILQHVALPRNLRLFMLPSASNNSVTIGLYLIYANQAHPDALLIQEETGTSRSSVFLS
jgi:hypothetical protein